MQPQYALGCLFCLIGLAQARFNNLRRHPLEISLRMDAELANGNTWSEGDGIEIFVNKNITDHDSEVQFASIDF